MQLPLSVRSYLGGGAVTVSVWQEMPDPIQVEHDDVVIGAGIVGCLYCNAAP